jgi:hypothetical protein
MGKAANRVRDTLRLVVDDAEASVSDVADAHEAWEIATTLAETLREESVRATRLRAVAALRIKDQDSLSLRGLADAIGVSPQRASVIVTGRRRAT